MTTEQPVFPVSVKEMLKALAEILEFLKPVSATVVRAETHRGNMVTELESLSDALKSMESHDVDVKAGVHNNRTARSEAGQLAWGDRPEGGAIGTKRVSC